MRRAVLFALAALLAFAAPLRADYLNEPGAFATAWRALLPRMTDRVEPVQVEVDPDRIRVIVPVPGAWGDYDLWQVRRGTTALAGGDLVEGPLPMPRATALPAHSFRLDEVALDRMDAIVAAALDAAKAGEGAAAVSLAVRRLAHADSAPGNVSIIVAVASPTRRGSVLVSADGRPVTAKMQDVAAPAPAPAPDPVAPPAVAAPAAPPAPPPDPSAAAAAALVAEVGPGAVVWEIEVRRNSLEVFVTDPSDARRVRRLRLTEEGFRRDGISMPNAAAHFGGSPFALADARLPDLERIVAAGLAAAGDAAGELKTVKAALHTSGAASRVVWTLVLAPQGTSGREAETRVAVLPDATVLRVVLPEAQRPPFRGDSGAGLVLALAELAAALGPDAMVWEVDARPGRVTVERPHPTQRGMTARIVFTDEGVKAGNDFPVMMQTEADLFPLSALAGLTPEAVEAARAAGLAAVGIEGAELERLRLWSGAPFWRHPKGQPFFDIRVGVPPAGRINGYAVVTLDGQVVRAFR